MWGSHHCLSVSQCSQDHVAAVLAMLQTGREETGRKGTERKSERGREGRRERGREERRERGREGGKGGEGEGGKEGEGEGGKEGERDREEGKEGIIMFRLTALHTPSTHCPLSEPLSLRVHQAQVVDRTQLGWCVIA